ncbi:6-phosphogluconolactonase, cycloisomerase 2 family [Amycolatopsis xylanica]|uniref:6-phosphogluconolactonase, cycloisomerase 2 family n=1 Tax=Amycolatopsis xylanica TaxID=589385 RepID=A0A1H3RVV3_9PSEU|nr:lactonase family protein [Amycolatopsis xylanica]SDZ29792.1 6-phosphogluconolactonase, cycloisomerase 2 family [Amycolatopsis xylanica]
MTGLNRRTFLGAVGAAGIASVVGARVAGATGPHSYGSGAIYISSYTDNGGHGLDVAHRTGADPALKVDRTISGVNAASWFDISADKRTLFVTNEDDNNGTISSFSLADPAKPKLLSKKSTKGKGPTHLVVHSSQKYVLGANYTSGDVVVLPILAGGKLGDATDLVKHKGAERPANAHQVVNDPTGRWVLSVDLGADSVYVYSLDVSTGKLKLNQQLKLPSGAGPRHLVFSRDGKYAYILGELRAEVTVAAWDAAAGKLTPGQVVAAVPPGTPGDQYPGEIITSSDGKFVYASVRGSDTIASFSISDGGKTLKLISNVKVGGTYPRHITLDPSEQWFYVSSDKSGTLSWLPRDPATGLPGAVKGKLSIPQVNSVRFF